MSESFATVRPSGGAEEFERRRRSLVPGSDAGSDPLAELARLVGKDDPFRGLAPQMRPSFAPAAPRDEFSAFNDDFRGALDAGEEAGAPDDPSIVHPGLDRHVPRGGAERGRMTMRTPPIPDVSPDTWARGADQGVPAIEPQAPAAGSREAGPERSSKRTLIVLAAVIVLTGGGLGASFLAKSSGPRAEAVATSATPTIMAATTPSKVQPETPAAGDADAPSEPSTLLDKNKNDGTASAKIVNSVEQPVDLNQAVKPVAAGGATDADQTATTVSPFPEPRKVKTVLVRPDGTIITDRAASTPEASSGTASSLAFDPKTSLPPLNTASEPAAVPPEVPVPVAAPATPAKSQARVAVTPKAGEGATSVPAQAAAATPAVKPRTVAAARPPATAEAAPAADATTASLPSGRFAAQLGAGGSEAEARELSSRLSRKFAEAVGGRLSIHKAQSGAKTVYRVRLGGLGQDAAKAVCAKVAAGGGGCFVARD